MKPTAKILRAPEADCPLLPGDVLVEFVWEGVDRPNTGGIVCPERIAPRLVAACNAGVLFVGDQVVKDVDGKTYVDTVCQVTGRHLHADLKKLGF
jgi:hypothetical protein